MLGFYTFNAQTVAYNELLKKYARSQPSHGSIPAGVISKIGVDLQYQGKGLGGVLLVEVLKSQARASEALGIAVILIDVLDCEDKEATERRQALYKDYGFTELENASQRLFLPIQDAQVLLIE